MSATTHPKWRRGLRSMAASPLLLHDWSPGEWNSCTPCTLPSWGTPTLENTGKKWILNHILYVTGYLCPLAQGCLIANYGSAACGPAVAAMLLTFHCGVHRWATANQDDDSRGIKGQIQTFLQSGSLKSHHPKTSIWLIPKPRVENYTPPTQGCWTVCKHILVL